MAARAVAELRARDPAGKNQRAPGRPQWCLEQEIGDDNAMV